MTHAKPIEYPQTLSDVFAGVKVVKLSGQVLRERVMNASIVMQHQAVLFCVSLLHFGLFELSMKPFIATY